MLEVSLLVLLALLAIVAAAVAWLWPSSPYGPAARLHVTIERLQRDPLIHADMYPSLQVQAWSESHSGGYDLP